MKVFSKTAKQNKSTPHLKPISIFQPSAPVLKPKGIAKVTNYKNQLTSSSNQTTAKLLFSIQIQQKQQQYPQTQRFNYCNQMDHSMRIERNVHWISPVPALGQGGKYKNCKSQKSYDNGREKKIEEGSREKLENVLCYAARKGQKENNIDKGNKMKMSQEIQSKDKPVHAFDFNSLKFPQKNTTGQYEHTIKNIYAGEKAFAALGDITEKENRLQNSVTQTSPKLTKKEEPTFRKIARKAQARSSPIQKLDYFDIAEPPKLSLSDFSVGKKLGKGRFGSVFMAEEKHTGMLFALKFINWPEVQKEEMESQIMQEIKLQLFMDHPNILKMYGCFRDGDQLIMILEYADQKCLFSKLQNQFEEKHVAYFARQMIEALKYCHSESILHRDLKPQNILICEQVAKLGDFGWAAYAPKYKRQTFCGTLDYVPPQILKGNYYDQKVDIWSLGVLIYEMATGNAPFQTHSIDQQQVQSKTMKRILEGDLSIPLTLSSDLRLLIHSILMTEPEKRPTLAQIEANPWIQKYRQAGNQIGKDIWKFWANMP